MTWRNSAEEFNGIMSSLPPLRRKPPFPPAAKRRAMEEAAKQPYRDEYAIRIKGKPDITDEEQRKLYFNKGPGGYGDLDGTVSFQVHKEPQMWIWEEGTTREQIEAFYEYMCLMIPAAREWMSIEHRKVAFWDAIRGDGL